MRIRCLTICLLLLACSCRFIVDPDQFRNEDGPGTDAAGGTDAISQVDAAGTTDAPVGCASWSPRFIDIDWTRTPGPSFVRATGAYSVDAANNALINAAGQNEVLLMRMTQSNGQPALVLWTESVVLGAGVTLSTQQKGLAPPLFIVSTSDITILGTVDGSSRGDDLGAGANASAVCNISGSQQSGFPATAGTQSGGGGGGFGGRGGGGGTADGAGGTQGVGGAAVSGSPLGVRGGCPGGSGGAGSFQPTPGGNGGGAIHFISCGQIVVNGTILAGGEGGEGGEGMAAGGGGGGSGGYIGFEAPVIDIQSNAILAANGGGGGGGASETGGTDGTDGLASTECAPGGAQIVSGGRGGALAGDALDGVSGGTGTDTGGGGGGGGEGYILLIGDDATTMVDPAAIVSPSYFEERLSQ